MARSVEMQLSRIFADVAIRRVRPCSYFFCAVSILCTRVGFICIPCAVLLAIISLVAFSSGPCCGFPYQPWGIAFRGCYGKEARIDRGTLVYVYFSLTTY